MLVETDYEGPGPFPLMIKRYYNSASHYAQRMGNGTGPAWRHTYAKWLHIPEQTPTVIYVSRADGTINFFRQSGANWISDSDINDKLSELRDAAGARIGWIYYDARAETTERYNVKGALTQIVARNGLTQTFTHSTSATPASIAPGPDYLISVKDHFGRTLNFTWNADGLLATVTDPATNVYRYSYNSDYMLASVTYPSSPDAAPMVLKYLYNEPEHTAIDEATLLTGVIDETGTRFATYSYDATGKAIGTTHAGGANKHTLSFGTGSTIVTDPIGSNRTYRFSTVMYVPRLIGVDQPGGAGGAAASSAVEYDANGNIKSRTNFNGVKTTYVYDTSRNLEVSRTEAAGTALARTITTEWHPNFRLPKRIAEPKRLTTYSYSAKGNLESKTVQPTNDPTGAQAFGATITNAAVLIKSNYTYDANGLPLTVVEPSSNGSPVINVTYTWSQGNLATAKNAAGHVTTYGNHDANGRPRSITAPNGAITTIAYHPRGWIESATLTAGGATRTTTYDYEPTGKLKRVTMPDQSYVSFSYDAAQRLNGITDSVGNTITYELDNAGNRIGEKTTDPAGTLSRQITRIYDALNRLQTVTGDQQ